jgi:preprotein translocase subunit SecF
VTSADARLAVRGPKPSINQTLSRTQITSFVAFLTVLALYRTVAPRCEGWPNADAGHVIGTLSDLRRCPLPLWLGTTSRT